MSFLSGNLALIPSGSSSEPRPLSRMVMPSLSLQILTALQTLVPVPRPLQPQLAARRSKWPRPMGCPLMETFGRRQRQQGILDPSMTVMPDLIPILHLKRRACLRLDSRLVVISTHYRSKPPRPSVFLAASRRISKKLKMTLETMRTVLSSSSLRQKPVTTHIRKPAKTLMTSLLD